MKLLKELLSKFHNPGIRFPYALDPLTKKPSITLLMVYTAFLMTIVSLIALHFRLDLLIATMSTMLFWVLGMIFYLIRNLQRASVSLKDESINLQGEPDSGNKKEEQ